MKQILINLGQMPIFKMSLGSKELFHSNFLEFLWEIDNDMFIRIVNSLLSKSHKKKLVTGLGAPKYELSREKENFDICIFHNEVIANRDRTVYDLVIENKVKSMPRKGQLNDYVSKISKNGYSSGCRYLLLSLVTGFPDIKDIKKTWAVANYLDLKNSIENQNNCWPQGKTYGYIKDYCEFIGEMHNLQNAILHGFSNSYLFQDVELELCKNYRLHDLYIKLRCDKFLTLLEGKLKTLNVGLPITFITKYNEIIKKGIYLNTSINQGVGQAAAFIHLHNGQPVNNYEIVIQGKQYRHGINSKKGTAQNNVRAQEQIWNAIGHKAQDFLCFKIYHPALYHGQMVLPDKCKTVKKVTRTVPLNGYDTTCIYKHIDIIEKTPVRDLLAHMADDIIQTIKTFANTAQP